MRTPILILPSVLLVWIAAGPVHAQDDEDHTPAAKVLSMSVTQWNADFARRHGGKETEASERQSLALYGDCLRARNDTCLARLPVRTRVRLRRVRAACTALSEEALSLSELYSGGGSMYIEIFSSLIVDDEEFAWSLIRQAGTREAARPAAWHRLVRTRLARMGVVVRAADPGLPRRLGQMQDVYGAPIPPDKIRQGRETYASLRADFADLRGLIAQAPPREAVAVSRYAAHGLPVWLKPIGEE